MAAILLETGEQSLTVAQPIPYEINIQYADGSAEHLAASLNDASQPVLTEKNDRWLTCNGKALFTADKQLLEVGQ